MTAPKLIPPLLGYYTMAGGGPNPNAYADKLKTLFTTSIISYLPLWESTGAYADDYYTTNNDGLYTVTGVTLGETGIGDGRTSIKLDGSTGGVNWKTAGLVSAFSGAEGTYMIWFKPADAGFWTDDASHTIIRITVDASNYTSIGKTTTDGRLEFNYRAGGVSEQYRKEGNSSTDWQCLAATWSKTNERVDYYVNGTRVGGGVTLGVFAGSVAIANIGAQEIDAIGNVSTSGQYVGWLAHALLLNREATPTEVGNAATLPFEMETSTPYGSSTKTIYVASDGSIADAIALMRGGDTLSLYPDATYTYTATGDGDLGPFDNIPSGIPSCHTKVVGNGATVQGGNDAIYLSGKYYIDFSDMNVGASKFWSLMCTNCSNLSFTDIDFYNPATGSSFDVCRWDNSSYVSLTRCTASSTTDYDGARAHDGFEIWGPASNFTFTDCVAYNIKNGSTVNEGHGFEVYGQEEGQIVETVNYINCEAYNCQVGFSVEGGPESLSHTDILCDGCSSHDNAFYGYQGIDGSTLYRTNVTGHDNTGNGTSETYGSVTDV